MVLAATRLHLQVIFLCVSLKTDALKQSTPPSKSSLLRPTISGFAIYRFVLEVKLAFIPLPFFLSLRQRLNTRNIL